MSTVTQTGGGQDRIGLFQKRIAESRMFFIQVMTVWKEVTICPLIIRT